MLFSEIECTFEFNWIRQIRVSNNNNHILGYKNIYKIMVFQVKKTITFVILEKQEISEINCTIRLHFQKIKKSISNEIMFDMQF